LPLTFVPSQGIIPPFSHTFIRVSELENYAQNKFINIIIIIITIFIIKVDFFTKQPAKIEEKIEFVII
jgi:hypothetical protein